MNSEPHSITALQKEIENLHQQVAEKEETCHQLTEALQLCEEQRLAFSEATFEAIFISEKGICIGQNLVAEQMFGYTLEEALGRSGTEWISAEWREVVHDNMLSGFEQPYEVVALRKDGSTFPAEIQGKMITYQERWVRVTALRDITKQVQANEKIRKLTRAIEQSPVSVVITDVTGLIEYVNPKFIEITGYSMEEVLGQSTRILKSGQHSAEFYETLWQTITSGYPWNGELINKAKDGSLFWELANIAPVKNDSGEITHYVAVKEDITLHKKIEARVHQQEHLAAVGQLAAGIAHDFNNLLSTIIGNADLMRLQPNVPQTMQSRLKEISMTGHRAAQLTRQILDFSRKSINHPQALDLVVYLKEVFKFIIRTIPENIAMYFNYAPGDYVVEADPAQLQQLITNLVLNARDAMPYGGELHLEINGCIIHEEHPKLAVGQWIALTVTDTGNGISEAALPHIFEPFFTTKTVGQGTGLGLAQVYGIMQQHQGVIDVHTEVDVGTSFTLYFPTKAELQASAFIEEPPIILGQGETVLVIEDEISVLHVIRKMLETLQYRVLTISNSQEALPCYQAHQEEIEVILSDIIMPHIDGFTLLRGFKALPNAPKVVLMSGYPLNDEQSELWLNLADGYLNKPLDLASIAQMMTRVLQKRG